jgi:hypothetical protein
MGTPAHGMRSFDVAEFSGGKRDAPGGRGNLALDGRRGADLFDADANRRGIRRRRGKWRGHLVGW